MISFKEGTPWAASSTALNAYVDAAAQDERSHTAERNYLGGSRLGVECERQLGYEWQHIAPDPGKEFSGRMLRIFERGHDAEKRIIRYMRGAGFEIVNERADGGGQIGFAVCRDPETGEARIRGHLDGVIVSGPAVPGITYPCLLEIKCLNDKNFAKVSKQGCREAKPVYYVQQQIYMAYLDLAANPSMFVVENADTCELHCEPVAFDARAAQTASDRGVKIVSTKNVLELPRIARDSTDFRCRFCSYAQRCWGETEVAPPAPALDPSWLGHMAQRGADTVNDARVAETANPLAGVTMAVIDDAVKTMERAAATGFAAPPAPGAWGAPPAPTPAPVATGWGAPAPVPIGRPNVNTLEAPIGNGAGGLPFPVVKPATLTPRQEAAREAVADPRVQAVLDAFPGSTIERVTGPAFNPLPMSKVVADMPQQTDIEEVIAASGEGDEGIDTPLVANLDADMAALNAQPIKLAPPKAKKPAAKKVPPKKAAKPKKSAKRNKRGR